MILLDMDGVLADWCGAVCELFGFDLADWPRGEYRVELALGISTEKLWRRLDETGDFWWRLRPYPWAAEMVATLKPAAVLSKPSKNPACWSGKAEWMRRHFPDVPLILCCDKALLAQPGRLLIDDYPRNCEAWRAAGGSVLLFPRPWNDAACWQDDPWQHVKETLGCATPRYLTPDEPALIGVKS